VSSNERRGGPAPRGFFDAPWFQNVAGWGIAQYIRLVEATNTIERDPPEVEQRRAVFEVIWPAIFVSWHANVLALKYFLEDGVTPGEIVPLVSPHFDGRLAESIIRRFGQRVIVGTGVSYRQSEGTGGVQALRGMIRELEAGNSVWLTAEVPPTRGRIVSPGVIALARASGRPIIAIAAASSRRTIVERLWDKMQINLPFGRIVTLAEGPIYVNGQVTNEEARRRLKILLDETYAEAMRRADLKARR
jgi:lysophospholipid acyltransferase (LPLAT)-like uncharacterized protein